MSGGRRPVLLVALGVVLLGSGLAMTTAQPRARSTDIGPPITAAPAETTVAQSTASAPSRAARPAPPPAAAGVEPTSLALPAVGEVPVVPVGVLPGGALQLPARPTTLGWYAAGASPGDATGTVVLAGHVDSAVFGAGPLARLVDLHLGDTLQVTDAAGAPHRFAVASRRSYAKTALPTAVFRRDGPARLAVITCGGAFDRRTGHYAENVVVIATAVGG